MLLLMPTMYRYLGLSCVIIVTYISKCTCENIGRYSNTRQYSRVDNENSRSISRFARDHDYQHNHRHMLDPSEDLFAHNPFLNDQKNPYRREVPKEEITNYPYQEIRKLIDLDPHLQGYFAEIPEIGNRGGEVPEDVFGGEDLCKTQSVKYYYPKLLKNINGIEILVVNDDDKYKQVIEYNTCITNGECNVPFDTFGYKSQCIQQFSTRRLLVYANETKQLLWDKFKLPSCCTCKIKKV